jgi:hypothetical protein
MAETCPVQASNAMVSRRTAGIERAESDTMDTFLMFSYLDCRRDYKNDAGKSCHDGRGITLN